MKERNQEGKSSSRYKGVRLPPPRQSLNVIIGGQFTSKT